MKDEKLVAALFFYFRLVDVGRYALLDDQGMEIQAVLQQLDNFRDRRVLQV